MKGKQPPVATPLPQLPAGHEWRTVRAVGNEDVPAVLARVRAERTWAVAIADAWRPHRIGPWWKIAIVTARLPDGPELLPGGVP